MQGVEPQFGIEAGTEEAEPAIGIHSQRSKAIAWVKFTNGTKNYVDIYWLNFLGKKILYQTLRPGGKSWQHTLESHPWIACKYDSEELLALNKRLVYIPSGCGQFEVAVHDPACLPWSQETHRRYPTSFQSSVKELLLSHSRKWCEREQPEAQSGSLRRSARLEAKRLRKETDPLGMRLAALPPELFPKIVHAMAPQGVLDLEHVSGENTLPGYEKMQIPQ